MKKIGLTIRIDKDLKETFDMSCRNQGLTTSLVIRELIKRYIKENAQTDIFKK